MKNVVIKFFALIFTVSVSSSNQPLFAFFNGNGYISDISAEYKDGSVVFTWTGSRKVNVYKSETADGKFVKTGKARRNSYKTKDAHSYFVFKAVKAGKESIATQPYSYIHNTLGPNVKVFTPEDNEEDIQRYISALYEKTAWDAFSLDRHAIFFMPGIYENVTVHVGYYTSVAGLGALPTDVKTGKFEILQHPLTGSMLTNFWRTVENFTINSNALFCVSQATSMRRMNITGDLLLTTGGWGSGGFISDSHISGTIRANDAAGVDRQQQWFTRNSSFGAFTGGQMNMVFVGVEGTLPALLPAARVTEVEKTGFVREKPFVIFDKKKGYGVFLPDARNNATGHSWKTNQTDGEFIEIGRFYVANAQRDNAATLNAELAKGKHILFSPGIYELEEPLNITKPNTIVMGLGLATLRITDGNNDTAMRIADAGGINISSLLFEAGAKSKSLLEVGSEKTNVRHNDNPVCIADLFFRSGATATGAVSVDQTLIINANDVFGDNFWLWRADHSFSGNIHEETMRFHKNAEDVWVMDGVTTADGRRNWAWNGGPVGWNWSYGKNGVIVNGDYVTIYGLMVEHYMEYQTIWNGEYGFMCFYQSETPYDAPNQAAWMRNGSDPSTLDDQGYPSYKVADHVQNHTALGVGVYYVSNTPNAVKILNNAIEAPPNAGITIKNMVIARFSGNAAAGSGIRHIINGHGQSAYNNSDKFYLSEYTGGEVISDY